jgi:hypothetical protein
VIGMRYCWVSACYKPAFIKIFSKTGRTLVAQYCEEHMAWALEQIAKPYHIIRKVK